MYLVYVLENEKGWHYIGSCSDVELRLKRHNQNSVKSTKHRGPFKVVYKEEFPTRTQARKRENQLKSYKGNSVFVDLLRRYVSPSSSPA